MAWNSVLYQRVNRQLKQFQLPIRVLEILLFEIGWERLKVKSAYDLKKVTDEELLAIPDFGPKSLKKVRQHFPSSNKSLKGDSR